ncbi:hypothetical protein ACFY84_29410 [Streptomyces sp. NPDC012438]|uniref:hypothetical protein n=1 Tax=Streptomyces sp. NPDC012438 TaxID=3364833 RepID=UPI0036E3E97B
MGWSEVLLPGSGRSTMTLLPAAEALLHAGNAGGRLADLVQWQNCGADQKCPWNLVLAVGMSAEQRAAAAWIVADEIMASRTGTDQLTYNLWRKSAVAGTKLAGTERELVHAYAFSVFGTPSAVSGEGHGLPGYVGEWLWYLTTRDIPPATGRRVEYLSAPGMEVRDSGGDGLIIHRVAAGRPELVFRLWEMKKYTGEKPSLTPTITGAWKQLSVHGARYLAQMSWGGKLLDPDIGLFVSGLVGHWVQAHPSSAGGVSVATNAVNVPAKAFQLAHKHFTTHTHPGAMQGLVVAVDDLDEFAQAVRGYVWSAL